MAGPLEVGLQISVQYREDESTIVSIERDSPTFVPTIMHHTISTRLFNAVVQRCASATQIARALHVSPEIVRDVWLDTPSKPLLRWRPAMMRPPVDLKQAGAVVQPQRPRSYAKATRTLADALVRRLSTLVAKRSVPSDKPQRRCGFSLTAHHEHLEVLCDGLAIGKTHPGLYKTALGATPLRGPHVYFEVIVTSDAGAGGVCIGVATGDASLAKLLGSCRRSVGMHSSGQLVRAGGTFFTYGSAYQAGDRVGCLVSFHSRGIVAPVGSYDVASSSLLNPRDCVELTFFVNGSSQPTIVEPILRDLPYDQRALYPAVSLYRDGSHAVLRCCQIEWDKTPPVDRGSVRSVCGN